MGTFTSCVLVALLCAGCSQPEQQSAAAPQPGRVLEAREGLASFVSPALDGNRTASGAPFDTNALVAAHPTYPFGTVVRVTNLTNGKSAEVRIVDRGPAPPAREKGVIIDLSKAAAAALEFVEDGTSKVRTEVLQWGQ